MLCPKVARRFAKHALVGPVKLCERLEPNVVSYLANPAIRVEELRPRIFDAHSRDIVGELQPGGSVEDFAEVKAQGFA